MSRSPPRRRAFGSHEEYFSRMLQRYPNVTNEELNEMRILFPRLAIVDVAIMSSDARLSGSLDSFLKEHCGRVQTVRLLASIGTFLVLSAFTILIFLHTSYI